MEVQSNPDQWIQVPILLHGGGFPKPPIHQKELLAYSSDDESEDSDDNDDEQKNKNSQKNQQNLKTHKKNKKSHKNLGSMLRTAAPKKIYKIPINPPKKIKKVKTQKKCCNDEVKICEHAKNPTKNQKNTSATEEKSKYNHSTKSESDTNLNIFAANANGLQGKEVSLKHEVKEANASIFCI